jgi:SpoU rRNA methylase family enzyme
MSPSIAHPQDHADQDHVDPHQLRYVGAAQMVHADRPAAGAGIPAARGPQRHGAVPGEKSEGPLAVVDELDAAVAVLEPEKVRLRVEPVDVG